MVSRQIRPQKGGALPPSCARCRWNKLILGRLFLCILASRPIHRMTPPPDWCPTGGKPC